MKENKSQLHNSLEQILAYFRSYNFKNGEYFVLRAAKSHGAQQILIGRIHPDGQGISLYTTVWDSKRKREGKGSVQVYRVSYTVFNPVEYLRDLALQPHVTAINSYPNHLKVRLENGCHVTDLGDDNVERFDTLFWEIDDLPLPAQTEKRIWLKEKLGLDVAISVFSGGKSEHNALSLTHEISLEDWLRLSFKLSIIMEGDIAICTLARAMRVPGVPRIKNGEQREVEIKYLSEAKYSAAEVESIFDSTGLFPHGVTSIHRSKIRSILRDPKLNRKEKWRAVTEVLQKTEEELQPQWEYKHSPSSSNNFPIEDSPLEEIKDAVPLEICLSKDDRYLLANGAGEGMRNNAAVKLLKNLIGTANRLTSLGYNYQGDPETLFFDFCQRCSPSLPHNEAVNIWRSISGSNPTATLLDDMLITCINAWRYQQLPKHLQRKLNREFARGFSSRPKKLISKEKKKKISKLITQIREYYPDFDFKETDPEKLWLLHQHLWNEVQCSRFLDLSNNLPRFLAIQSPMYTGKTYQLAQILKEYPNSSILIITHLTSLATTLAQQFDCACYHELHPGELNEQKRLVITTESLHKLKTFGKKFDFVIIDEVDQEIESSILSPTNKKNRHLTITILSYFIRNSNHFICADANLSSLVLGYLECLCNTKAHVVVNEYQVHQGRTAYRFDDETRHLLYLLGVIAAGGRPLIVGDTKTFVKKISGILGGADKHISGFDNLPDEWKEKLKNLIASLEINPLSGQAIHGDNSQYPEIKKFIADINHRLDVEKLDFLAINSALSSGISIEPSTKAFTHVMCFFNGTVLSHTVLTQLPHRLRDLEVELSYSFQNVAKPTLETDVHAILYDYINNRQDELKALGFNPNTGIPEPEVLLLVCGLEARRNWSINNNQFAFEKQLSKLGYKLELHSDELFYQSLPEDVKLKSDIEQKKAKDILKEHGNVVKEAEILATCKIPLPTHDEAKALKERRSLTFEEKCALNKYIISEFTGMTVDEPLVRKWYKDRVQTSVPLLEHLLNPSLAKIKDLLSMGRTPYLHDHTHYVLQTELLILVNLLDYLDLDTIYDNENLQPLADLVKKHASLFKRRLNITIHQASPQLKELRETTLNDFKLLLTPETTIYAKWILEQLAQSSAKKGKKIPKGNADNEKHNLRYCKDCLDNMTSLLRMTAYTIFIEKIFNQQEMSPNAIHGALCRAIGLSRRTEKQTRTGKRTYQIDPEFWNFNMAVIKHHANQRAAKDRKHEAMNRENAQRFDEISMDSMQDIIVESITANKGGETPDLVFLTENQPAADNSETTSNSTLLHPPQNTTKDIYSRGGVENPKIKLGVEVLVARLIESLDEDGLEKVKPKIVKVYNMATGVNKLGDKFHYLNVRSPEGKKYWIPIEWCTSVDGAPVVIDPVRYDPLTYPRESVEVLRNWLNGVETVEEFLQWESGRKRNEINAVIKVLSQAEWIDLAYKLEKWGIQRDWLPIEAIPQHEQEDVFNACKFLENGINENYEELSHFMEVIKEYLKICPDAVQWLKIALSQSLKDILERLMPSEYLDLIEQS